MHTSKRRLGKSAKVKFLNTKHDLDVRIGHQGIANCTAFQFFYCKIQPGARAKAAQVLEGA